jgi:hypothetical protein
MTPSLLSPGTDHRLVPRDAAGNLAFRAAVLEEAARDAGFRAGLVEACRRDLLFFTNVFVWQFNPKRPGDEFGPFVTWPAQDEYLMWLWRGTRPSGTV